MVFFLVRLIRQNLRNTETTTKKNKSMGEVKQNENSYPPMTQLHNFLFCK